jgi:hypothetical protein
MLSNGIFKQNFSLAKLWMVGALLLFYVKRLDLSRGQLIVLVRNSRHKPFSKLAATINADGRRNG